MRLDLEDPRRMLRKLPPETSRLDRVLLRAVEDEAGCWLFTGAHGSGGYGVIRAASANYYAHRVAYEAAFGSIPDGFVVDHRCRVRHCVNPAHLEAVTNHVNTRERARHSGSGLPVDLYCKRGHERTEANTYHRPDGKGTNCHTCIRMRSRR